MTVNIVNLRPKPVPMEHRCSVGEAFRAPLQVWRAGGNGEVEVPIGGIVVVLEVSEDGRWLRLLSPGGTTFRWAMDEVVGHWWRL